MFAALAKASSDLDHYTITADQNSLEVVKNLRSYAFAVDSGRQQDLKFPLLHNLRSSHSLLSVVLRNGQKAM